MRVGEQGLFFGRPVLVLREVRPRRDEKGIPRTHLGNPCCRRDFYNGNVRCPSGLKVVWSHKVLRVTWRPVGWGVGRTGFSAVGKRCFDKFPVFSSQ